MPGNGDGIARPPRCCSCPFYAGTSVGTHRSQTVQSFRKTSRPFYKYEIDKKPPPPDTFRTAGNQHDFTPGLRGVSMRTLLCAVLPVLFLANPVRAQTPGDPTPTPVDPPGVTITDKSTVVQQNKINAKASVVPAGGAMVVSVKFDVMKGNNRADGGTGTKLNGTDDWTMGNTIPLGPGTYKVTTTVTYTLPGVAGNQTMTKDSGNLVIP